MATQSSSSSRVHRHQQASAGEAAGPAAPSLLSDESVAFELLEAKLLPPRGGGTVSRDRLIGLLEASGAAPIVVVSAGAGWGKTTLLAHWVTRSPRPFAWVSVDENDNDPIVLLTYVAAALDRVAPLDPEVFRALASPGASVEGTIVPRLGAALASTSEEVVVVLDDLHTLENPTCLDAIATLARHVPAGSQLALSARSGPTFPLGALRTRGLVLEIGPDELRMDEGEARELLGAAGLDLPDEEVTELYARTEGWSAGLYLGALSVRAQAASAERGGAFLGSDRLVSDYLRSELLSHLSPEDFRFLTWTAILDRMSGPLCDAVLETSGSAAKLESLAHSNLFLVPLDPKPEWYRYHHLFQELLRSELDRTGPDLVRRLLARAADWHVANAEPETAIRYAQEAGDTVRVAHLAEQCTSEAYESGRATTADGWLHWLEARGALEHNAAIAVLGGLVATIWGRAAEAKRWADAAERASYDSSLPDGSASIESWLAFLRALRCAQGAAKMRADAELAVRTLAPASPFRVNATLLLGVSCVLAGDIEQAEDLFTDVAEEGLELVAPEAAAIALAEHAAIAIGRDAWDQAEELVDRAGRIVRRSRMDEYPTNAFACAVKARVALHRGRADRAREALAHAQRLRPRLTYALPYFAIQTRLELARAYQSVADAAGAETMLREIDTILRRQPALGTLPSQAEELRASLKTMRADAPGASTLTEAELRVLPYLATHLSFREIGERLYISRHTVKSQVMAVYRKLSVSRRHDAVERASALGLL